MPTTTYRGTIQGGTTVLLETKVPLPDGTPVQVTPIEAQHAPPGDLLAVMKAPPHLTREDVDEWEKAIAAGKRPRSRVDPFPE